MDHSSTFKPSVFLKISKEYERVYVEDILYFKADRNYCDLVTLMEPNKIKCICKPLAHIEQMEELQNFARVHRSFLVNKQHIVSYRRGKHPYVKASNGTQIPLSANLFNSIEKDLF